MFTSCKKEAAREQFIGIYDVTQSCGGGPNSTYQISISEYGEGEGVSIGNLGNLGLQVTGICDGDQVSFNQHSGVVPVDGSPVTFTINNGVGTISSETLTIPFSFSGTNGWNDTGTMTCTKN